MLVVYSLILIPCQHANLCFLPLIGEPVCAILPNPSNGVLQYNDTVLIETTQVMYSCEVNYTLSGDSTRTCGSVGTWGGSAPTCQGIGMWPRSPYTIIIQFCP